MWLVGQARAALLEAATCDSKEKQAGRTSRQRRRELLSWRGRPLLCLHFNRYSSFLLAPSVHAGMNGVGDAKQKAEGRSASARLHSDKRMGTAMEIMVNLRTQRPPRRLVGKDATQNRRRHGLLKPPTRAETDSLGDKLKDPADNAEGMRWLGKLRGVESRTQNRIMRGRGSASKGRGAGRVV